MKITRGILFLCFGALCALVLAENENVTDVDPGAGNEEDEPEEPGRKMLHSSCGRRYDNPIYIDLPPDWCKYFERSCGAAAANEFCRKKGYSEASSYRGRSNVAKTLTVGNHAVCDRNYHRCDSFASIECKRTTCRIYSPYYRNQPLDWCKFFESQCGKPAADRFCQLQGYSEAKDYRKRAYTGSAETICIGNHAECDPRHHGCDTFRYITCG